MKKTKFIELRVPQTFALEGTNQILHGPYTSLRQDLPHTCPKPISNILIRIVSTEKLKQIDTNFTDVENFQTGKE